MLIAKCKQHSLAHWLWRNRHSYITLYIAILQLVIPVISLSAISPLVISHPVFILAISYPGLAFYSCIIYLALCILVA
jgi:hypothetical protein